MLSSWILVSEIIRAIIPLFTLILVYLTILALVRLVLIQLVLGLRAVVELLQSFKEGFVHRGVIHSALILKQLIVDRADLIFLICLVRIQILLCIVAKELPLTEFITLLSGLNSAAFDTCLALNAQDRRQLLLVANEIY